MAAHRNLASKFFCSCCRDCEETSTTDDSTFSSQTQEQQTGLQKSELDLQNSKGSSLLPLGPPLVNPEKETSTSSSDFEDATQRVFSKRNLDRYSQTQWPFQSCFIGRP